MSRFENNKFVVNFEEFNIRDVVNEVKQIMDFQIAAKQLRFIIDISREVP